MTTRVTKAKAIVALVGGILAPAVVLLQSAVTDDRVTTDEWVKIGIALLVGLGTAVTVQQVPNRPVSGEHRMDVPDQPPH